jgi:hypothetical protein
MRVLLMASIFDYIGITILCFLVVGSIALNIWCIGWVGDEGDPAGQIASITR